MPLLEDMASHLVSTAGVVLGTDLFLAELPPSPDAASVLLEYAGGPVKWVMGDAEPALVKYYFQVVSRALSYGNARTQGETLYQALAEFTARTINGTPYMIVEPMQPPFPMQLDESQRYRFSFNVEVVREY